MSAIISSNMIGKISPGTNMMIELDERCLMMINDNDESRVHLDRVPSTLMNCSLACCDWSGTIRTSNKVNRSPRSGWVRIHSCLDSGDIHRSFLALPANASQCFSSQMHASLPQMFLQRIKEDGNSQSSLPFLASVAASISTLECS